MSNKRILCCRLTGGENQQTEHVIDLLRKTLRVCFIFPKTGVKILEMAQESNIELVMAEIKAKLHENFKLNPLIAFAGISYLEVHAS